VIAPTSDQVGTGGSLADLTFTGKECHNPTPKRKFLSSFFSHTFPPLKDSAVAMPTPLKKKII